MILSQLKNRSDSSVSTKTDKTHDTDPISKLNLFEIHPTDSIIKGFQPSRLHKNEGSGWDDQEQLKMLLISSVKPISMREQVQASTGCRPEAGC